MTEKYFSKFPTFKYRGKEAIDITRRIKINVTDKNNPYNFYPFQLRDELRSDQVAEFYYNDPEMDWMVYHVNDIIDPYYNWYLNDEAFESMVVNKYGSLEKAKEKIKFYRNNWPLDDTQITPSQFDNVIPHSWKKYFEPTWGPKAEIISYKRKEDNSTVNTNRILRYNVSFVTGNTYTKGEIVDIKYSGAIVGGGEIEYANSSTISIKNVSGNTIANSTVVINILGETSGSNSTSNAVVTVTQNLTLEEEVFWSPVYYYDYEREINESKKFIKLINNELSPLILTEFEEKLQE